MVLVVFGLTTCDSTKKAASTSEMFKIPKKIINAEDLPPMMREYEENQVHYVQLYPDDKPPIAYQADREEAIEDLVEQSVKEEAAVLIPEKSDVEKYVDEKIDNLVHSRQRPVFYHIVSGSFQVKLYADLFAEHLKNIGYGNTYVRFFDNGFNRVIVQRYSNEVEARQYLQGYRIDNPLYADAWLYYNLDASDDPMAYLTR